MSAADPKLGPAPPEGIDEARVSLFAAALAAEAGDVENARAEQLIVPVRWRFP